MRDSGRPPETAIVDDQRDVMCGGEEEEDRRDV